MWLTALNEFDSSALERNEKFSEKTSSCEHVNRSNANTKNLVKK